MLDLLNIGSILHRLVTDRHIYEAVALAIREGRLIREPCIICGVSPEEKVVVAHHESYAPDKWFDVIWLCRSDHRKLHQGTVKLPWE